MLAVQGIYDGKNFMALEAFPTQKRYKVIITFVEEIDETEDLRQFSSQIHTFSFWEDSREDLYQDFLTPPRNP